MLKKRIVVLLFFIIIIFNVCIFINNCSKKVKNRKIYLVQISELNVKNTINKFKYYDDNGKLIKEESFSDIGDVSYYSINNDFIYSYGPGGLYKTDVNNLKTKKISEKDINIVKVFNGSMFYYENIGYKNNCYFSKICNEKGCIDTNMAVIDFAIDEDFYYVLGLDSLYIYKDSKEINKINLLNNLTYRKILNLNNDFYLLDDKNFYEINPDGLGKKYKNIAIKDSNFSVIQTNNDNIYIFDRIANTISVIDIENINILKIFNLKVKGWFSYSFESNRPILYTVDYDGKKLLFFDIDNNKIREFAIKLNKNESIFMAYELQ